MLTGILLRKKGKIKTLTLMLIVSAILLIGGILMLVKGLREYIADVDFLNLAGEYDNALKATEMISRGEVQLLFLDIQMPKITGLEFMKTLQKPVPVIFTTAFPQYALDGFDLNALDYLVKPISFDRFLKAALKAKEYYEVRQKNDADKTPVSGS